MVMRYYDKRGPSWKLVNSSGPRIEKKLISNEFYYVRPSTMEVLVAINATKKRLTHILIYRRSKTQTQLMPFHGI